MRYSTPIRQYPNHNSPMRTLSLVSRAGRGRAYTFLHVWRSWIGLKWLAVKAYSRGGRSSINRKGRRGRAQVLASPSIPFPPRLPVALSLRLFSLPACLPACPADRNQRHQPGRISVRCRDGRHDCSPRSGRRVHLLPGHQGRAQGRLR